MNKDTLDEGTAWIDAFSEQVDYEAKQELDMAEASQYNAAANVAYAVDQRGIQWLLDILPDFMDNPIETQKVHELSQYAKNTTFGKGVKI